jgi:hypothetical protein
MARPAKYRCNHRFFESIDAEAPAYWLGFLAADGCISPSNNTVKLGLSEKDRAHIERFREALESNHPIRSRCGTGFSATTISAQFQIASAAMLEDLGRHGIHPRKTFSLRWPVLPDALIRHYLRGYFDGDGCFTGSRQGSLSFSLAGNRDFLLGCRRYLVDSCSLRETQLISMPATPQGAYLQYCGTGQVQAIGRLLYDGATIWLPRKRVVLDAHPARRGQYKHHKQTPMPM